MLFWLGKGSNVWVTCQWVEGNTDFCERFLAMLSMKNKLKPNHSAFLV